MPIHRENCKRNPFFDGVCVEKQKAHIGSEFSEEEDYEEHVLQVDWAIHWWDQEKERQLYHICIKWNENKRQQLPYEEYRAQRKWQYTRF